MSISREVVSGIGIAFSKEIRKEFFPLFSEADFDEILWPAYHMTCEYNGPVSEWLLVPIAAGDTLEEVEYGAFQLLEKLNALGMGLGKTDLIFISDIFEN